MLGPVGRRRQQRGGEDLRSEIGGELAIARLAQQHREHGAEVAAVEGRIGGPVAGRGRPQELRVVASVVVRHHLFMARGP